MARICAFVFNPAIRDARVIKQANSLAAQGHEVTIIGLADNNYPEESAVLESGVEILRVPREVGRVAKGTAFFGGLTELPRKMMEKSVHLLLLPILMVYVAFAGLTGTLEERAAWLLDLFIYGLLAAGLIYILINVSKLIDAALFVAETVYRRIRSTDRGQRIHHVLSDLLRRVAPAAFENEIERRFASACAAFGTDVSSEAGRLVIEYG
jgi:hypothetical protein